MSISHDPVFLDTVGLIALWDASDQWHAAALPVFQVGREILRQAIADALELKKELFEQVE